MEVGLGGRADRRGAGRDQAWPDRAWRSQAGLDQAGRGLAGRPGKWPGPAPRRRVPGADSVFSAALLAVSLLLLSVCGQARAQDLFLWSVEAPDGSTLLHLFGSIHMASADTYPLPDRVMEAFARSDRLVVEADVTDAREAEVLARLGDEGILAPPATLWDLVGPETEARLDACLAQTNLPKMLFDRFKPWMASLTLEAVRLIRQGYDEKLGLDRHFLTLARERGLPIAQLESVAEQMGLFLNLTDEQSLQLLEVSILECGTGADELERLLASWRRGDLAEFEELYFKAFREHPELTPLLDKIIHQRNESMHRRLQDYLAPGTTSFVVIGAAHMVGADGIPERLMAQGLSVVRR